MNGFCTVTPRNLPCWVPTSNSWPSGSANAIRGEESAVVPAVGSVTVIGKVKAPSARSRRAPGTARAASVARQAARSAPAKVVKATRSTAKPPEKPAKSAKSSTVPVKRRG